MTEEERFWTKVDVRGEDECWPWTGSIWNGYGIFVDDEGRSVGSHRYALEEKLGRFLGHGLYAIHSCDYPPCCNPSHLAEGTPVENMKQMWKRGRAGLQKSKSKYSLVKNIPKPIDL